MQGLQRRCRGGAGGAGEVQEVQVVQGVQAHLRYFYTLLLCYLETGGEHPVSAKFQGLRNRFVRWWVLGAPHEQPIFTPAFEKSVIFAGANRVSAAFQLRFSCVSAAFQLRFSSLEDFFSEASFFWSQNIRVPQSQTFGQTFFLCFSCVSAGKNGVLTLCCVCS